jgi:hypothetical protein
MTELFYVRDTRVTVGNSVMWWGIDRKGYTTHIDKAGKYTAKECDGMRETDVRYPVDAIDAIWSHHVDVQHLRQLPTVTNSEDKGGAL